MKQEATSDKDVAPLMFIQKEYHLIAGGTQSAVGNHQILDFYFTLCLRWLIIIATAIRIINVTADIAIPSHMPWAV